MIEKHTKENKAMKKSYHNEYKVITAIIFIAVGLIVIANTACILIVCYPKRFGIEITESLTGSQKIEASLLSVGISIIGLAVAVWTGLSIANSIDKKHIDDLNQNMRELNDDIGSFKKDIDNDFDEFKTQVDSVNTDISDFKEQIKIEEEQRKEEQKKVDMTKLLYEMYLSANDKATKVLIETIKKLGESSGIPFLKLVEIEQRFVSVYQMHKSKFDQNTDLLMEAAEGIELAKSISSDNNNLNLYLQYRIAEFHFYSGYCCLGKERLEHFTKAIEIYQKCKNDFRADIPEYDPDAKYPDINYLSCKGIPDISAYFCNSIGEAYSKIEQDKKQLKEAGISEGELETYGRKAVFYCAYASHWISKSIYKRNLGCAIERVYGALAHYEELREEYEKALSLDTTEINNFKNLVSLDDKYINGILQIKPVALPERRVPALCSRDFAITWTNLEAELKSNLLDTLQKLHTFSRQTKALHPSESVGYQYDCIYYRDMCAIYGNHTLEKDEAAISEMKKTAKSYLEKAEEDWTILNIAAPYDSTKPKVNPMTQILRNDLDDLRNLI